MKCSKCGTEFDSRFCPNCGTPAYDLPAQQGGDIITDSEQPLKKPSGQDKQPVISGKTKWIFIVAAGLFIIIIIVLIVAFGGQNSSGGSDKISQYGAGAGGASQSGTPAAAGEQTSSQIVSSVSESTEYAESATPSNTTPQTASQPAPSNDTQVNSQDDTQSAEGEATPSGPNISNYEFNQIQDGMTYNEVKEIIGSDGQKQSEMGNIVVYKWSGNGNSDSYANITLKDGKVEFKISFGLQ